MKIDVRTIDNKVKGNIDLSNSVYGAVVRKDILARVVRWQLAKRQAGTHQTKTISMIRGTTKKPFRQKGTGNARQGSLRSPQFRGGAVIFGPVVHSHAHKLNKKVRALGLCIALSAKAKENKLIVIEDLQSIGQKAKNFKSSLNALAGNALVVDTPQNIENLRRAGGNFISYGILSTEGANVYDILSHDYLIMSKEAAKTLEEKLHARK